MFKLTNVLNTLKPGAKATPEGQAPTNQPNNFVEVTRNWYEERSDRIIVQRNILLVLSCLLVLLVIAAVTMGAAALVPPNC